jgi:DNA repair photolyase
LLLGRLRRRVGIAACPHGCVYCYATRRRQTALERYRRHDPEGEYLFTPETRAVESPQLALF